MTNSYAGVLDDWKVDLITRLARRKGFRRDEMDDVLQSVVLGVANFKFDTAKANGGTEQTALTGAINKQLLAIQRRDARAKRKHQAHCRDCGMRNDDEPVVDESHAHHQRRYELREDVQTALRRLSPHERRVCNGLMGGKTDTQIAAELGCDRYHIAVVVDTVRTLFTSMGLNLI